MKYYRYNAQTGVTRIKSKAKKYIAGITVGVVAAAGAAIPAFAAGGPTPGPVFGPGCFGNWRAGSVQDINGKAPGTNNAGAQYFSDRAGTNSTINAENRAECATL